MFFVDLAARQQEFIDRYAIITDPQERLAAVIERRSRLEPLAVVDRIDANLVRGCVSRVWIVGAFDAERRLRLRTGAESSLVRGLVALLCELYDGADSDAVAGFEPAIFEKLGIAQNLSPTRLHGLAQVPIAIRNLARPHEK